jgi:hypothetical protein
MIGVLSLKQIEKRQTITCFKKINYARNIHTCLLELQPHNYAVKKMHLLRSSTSSGYTFLSSAIYNCVKVLVTNKELQFDQ